MLKRYLVFAGAKYYASGGMWDFERDCDDLDEAMSWIELDMTRADNDNDWYQVYDQQTRGFVNNMKGGGHV